MEQCAPVDCDVETKELDECLVIPKAKEGCKVSRVIFTRVNGRQLSITKHIAEYTTGDVRQFGNPTEVNISNQLSRTITHRSMESSNVDPQYSFLDTPSWYALAKAESWLSAVTARENWLIG
jgi:hypothetical protein